MTNRSDILGLVDSRRSDWLTLLGLDLDRPQKFETRALSHEILADHHRTHLSYITEDESRTDAYLLEPSGPPPPTGFPAAVVFHATTDNHIKQPVGLADKPSRHIGLELVRRGWLVICPRNFIYGYQGLTWNDAVGELYRRYPRLTGIGKMLWDGMRAMDFLESRSDVDPNKIACIGHSLGAKEALYLSALDPRVRAAVASEGGVGLTMSNWDAPWYWGARQDSLSGRDHDELIALTAPRALMVIGGGDADGEHSHPVIEAGRISSGTRPEESLRLLIHQQGHDFPDKVREEAYDWMEEMISRGNTT